MKNRLARSTPEAQGIASSAILAFVEAVQKQIHEFHSFMLVRHGQVVAEGWWSPYAPEKLHMLFSLSKSFTSSAIGLAVTEKRLSIDDPVLSFFPEDAPAKISPNLAAMRVRHLLSMSTGHAEDTMIPIGKRKDGNWTKAFLAAPVEYEPGTHFLYNTGATYMLSAIIQKVTGMKLIDYLTPRLFQPLGIDGAWWEESPQGINTGGFGLNVKTEDIACFGQMYLQKGKWKNKRILPESWVELASSSHISNGDDPKSDWAQGYGFQFWRCRHNAYRGDGAFGQYCVVMPEQDAVLAITAGVADMQQPLNLVWDILLPAMTATPLPEDAVAQAALKAKLAGLKFDAPKGKASAKIAAQVSGQTYVADGNELNLKAACIDFAEAGFTANFKIGRRNYQIAGGYGEWRDGKTGMFNAPHIRAERGILASGVWTAKDTFAMTVRQYETPFFQTITARFDGDQLLIESGANVGFMPQVAKITARRKA